MKEESIYAGVLLVAITNKWPLQTAIHFLTILTAMTHPAIATVPRLFETKLDREWRRIISQYLEAYAEIVCVPGNHDIIYYVDGARHAFDIGGQ